VGVMSQSRLLQLCGSLIDNYDLISLKATQKPLFTVSAEFSFYNNVRSLSIINLRKKEKLLNQEKYIFKYK